MPGVTYAGHTFEIGETDDTIACLTDGDTIEAVVGGDPLADAIDRHIATHKLRAATLELAALRAQHRAALDRLDLSTGDLHRPLVDDLRRILTP